MKKILLTGASGFVGKRYLPYSKSKYEIHPFSVTNEMPDASLLGSIDAIVHLGGLAHQMIKVAPEKYFIANFERTAELARLAKAAGVAHFIFISTIKVFGESQSGLLTKDSPCLPANDPYGESKLKAELYLCTLIDENFMVTIIRPPLIYGPGVKGNLDKLLKLADSGYPLPFKMAQNSRTMIYLDNFIELINHIIDTKAGGLVLAGDDRPITTEELITKIRQHLGRPIKLFRVLTFFRSLLKIARPELAIRLFGSLEMDSSTSNKKIGFVPPYTIDAGIKSMVDAYIKNKKERI